MKKSFLYLFAGLLLVGYAISCSGRDDRDEIRARNGDPDEIITLGKDDFWRETWLYFDVITINGESAGIAYELRRNSGCGVVQDVFLFAQYPISNPPGDSTATPRIMPRVNNRNPLLPY